MYVIFFVKYRDFLDFLNLYSSFTNLLYDNFEKIVSIFYLKYLLIHKNLMSVAFTNVW